MINRNKKRQLNKLYGHGIVQAVRGDNTWVLPDEFVGLELETENWTWGLATVEERQDMQQWWVAKQDMSLVNGTEWILTRPLAGRGLTSAVDMLFSGKYKYTMSERTSTHVHINMSDGLDIEVLRAMFVLTYVVEPAIFRLADENRKWCSYCQPLSDFSAKRLVSFLNSDNDETVRQGINGGTHADKYYGFNITSMQKHGTIEFRYFPCTQSKKDVISWIQLCMSIKKAGIKWATPTDLLVAMGDTVEDARNFVANTFPANPAVAQLLDYEEVLYRIRWLKALLNVELVDALLDRKAVKITPAIKFVAKKLYNRDFDAQAAAGEGINDPVWQQVIQRINPEADPALYNELIAIARRAA